MNAELLLQHFDRISEAPDAVSRLRKFILDLAVQGKLVEQEDPDTEYSGRDHCGAELPFPYPAGWKLLRLTDVTKVSYGFAFPSQSFNSEKRGLPLIRIRDISKKDTEAYYDGVYDSEYVVSPGDYLVGMDGNFNLRRWRGPIALLNQRVMRLKDWSEEVLGSYIAIPLQMVLDQLHGVTSQTTVKHLSAKQVRKIVIPVPPLSEQHRIVAQVDELMALCDELEAAQAKRENRRDRLVAATLQTVNNGDTDSENGKTLPFSESARFYLDHVSKLTTRPEHIRQLRETILNLAVRGKLLEQDPNDEPAALLFERISRRKEMFGASGGMNSADTEPVPFAVPKSWMWVRWDQIAQQIGDIDHKMPDAVSQGIPYVSPRDFLPNNGINFEGAKKIAEGDFRRLSAKIRPEQGDLIYPRYGTIGENRVVTIDRPFLASYSCAVIKVMRDYIDPWYQYYFSISDVAAEQAMHAVNKATQPNVGIRSIKRFWFPLPPLTEQKHIVSKVNELMSVCKDLDQQIAAGQLVSKNLMESLLDKAYVQE